MGLAACLPACLQTVLMELHEVGPTKLFDTAGVDEEGVLGEKKRRKVLSVIKVSKACIMYGVGLSNVCII